MEPRGPRLRGLAFFRGVMLTEHAGLIHLHGMLRLVWEERRVSLRTEDDEALWRLVFRRSGMGRLEFKQALELGRSVYSDPLTSITLTCAVGGLALRLPAASAHQGNNQPLHFQAEYKSAPATILAFRRGIHFPSAARMRNRSGWLGIWQTGRGTCSV